MRGRLEREIRLLPQVLACTVSGNEIVVLIPPAADPTTIEQAVLGVLGPLGGRFEVSVVGGTAGRDRAPGLLERWTRSSALLVASVAVVAVVAVAALLVGLSVDPTRVSADPPDSTASAEPSSPSGPSPSRPSAGPSTDVIEPSEQPTTRPPQVLGQRVIRASASPRTTSPRTTR